MPTSAPIGLTDQQLDAVIQAAALRRVVFVGRSSDQGLDVDLADGVACGGPPSAVQITALAAIGSQRASPVLFSAAFEPGDVTERISGQTARDVEHRTDNIRTNDSTGLSKEKPGQRGLTGLSQTPQFLRGFRRSSREPQLLPINGLRGRFADNPPQL